MTPTPARHAASCGGVVALLIDPDRSHPVVAALHAPTARGEEMTDSPHRGRCPPPRTPALETTDNPSTTRHSRRPPPPRPEQRARAHSTARHPDAARGRAAMTHVHYQK